jgi:hypothetical protein
MAVFEALNSYDMTHGDRAFGCNYSLVQALCLWEWKALGMDISMGACHSLSNTAHDDEGAIHAGHAGLLTLSCAAYTGKAGVMSGFA